MSRVRKHPHAGHQGASRDFIKLVGDLTRGGGRSHREVLDDFLELAFCAIAKTTHAPDSARATELESRYMALVAKRGPDYIRRMPELLGMAELGVREGGDFLGVVAGELGALSGGLGQFFTPYELSSLIARMSLGDREQVAETIASKGWIEVGEPACGAGGMLLAVADALDEFGFDSSTSMRAVACDVSGLAFRMAYVQLSLRGIAASVIHGDTLRLEEFAQEATPALLAFNVRHAARLFEPLVLGRFVAGEPEAAPQPKVRARTSLFAELEDEPR